MVDKDRELTEEEKKQVEATRRRVVLTNRINERMGAIKHKIIIASGKGGVGKSCFAVNLAKVLVAHKRKVGFLDGDIHGPSAGKFFGIKDRQLSGEAESINPQVTEDGIRVMSMAFLLGEADSAVIWRGPLKMQMIDSLLGDVNWGELDYLVIDTPPGTGDEILSLAQRIKNLDGIVMITTPQSAAVASAVKTISFAKSMKTPLIGVVENMGPFKCPDCGREIKLFGAGGGEQAAKSYGVPFLGSIPFDELMEGDSEVGLAVVVEHPHAPSAVQINRIAEKIMGLMER